MEMKKSLLLIISALVVSCTPLQKNDSEQKEQYIISKRSTSYMVDLCDPENMPRFQNRPRINSKELAKMSESEMDDRIKRHLRDMDRHIDHLESVIVKTRQRVESCR